jgi:SAM-dependent methyltransferase
MHYLRQLAGDGTTHIHPGGAKASVRLIEALALSAGQVVLEIGCGPGATLAHIAASCDLRVIGIDLMPEMLATAARRLRWSGLDRYVALLRGDAARLPIATGSCDRIYAESVIGIQDESSLIAMLAEIHRALKPGGRCVLNEAIWRATASDAEIEAANRVCLAAFGLRQASAAPWRADDWNRAMNQAGFRVLAQGPTSEPANHRREARAPARMRIASRALSLLQRVESALRPSERRRKLTYRALLRQHTGLGPLIESRLFVLESSH